MLLTAWDQLDSQAADDEPVPFSYLNDQIDVPQIACGVTFTTEATHKIIAERLTESLVYGDIWERPGLSKRDRSLITVAALVALYRPDQLKGHTARALANGVTKEEIGELITHLAFYAGWPSAMSAAKIAKQVFEEKPA